MNVAERQRPPAGELYLDHLAHYVPDLDAAAAVWQRLGFAVTPTSIHNVSGKPAGTCNRCVMLEDGYLELLAPTLDTPHAQRVRERMQLFVGVHLACFGTPDAAAEHRRLIDHGFEPDPLVNLERSVEGGALARFNVIYVPPGKMPEGRVQYVEQLTPQHVWREGFVNPFRLTALYVVADDPVQTAARWARFAGLLPRPDGDLVELECARGQVRIGRKETIEKVFGYAPPAPALAGYALSVRDVPGFAKRCEQAGLKARTTAQGQCVALPPVLGGAWLITAPR
jgi:hypothetical protein